MGAGFTAPFDRAAGPDGHLRPLTVAQADQALYERLAEIVRAVDRARHAVWGEHGAHSPVLQNLDEIQHMLQELINDADHVRLLDAPALPPVPSDAAGSAPPSDTSSD